MAGIKVPVGVDLVRGSLETVQAQLKKFQDQNRDVKLGVDAAKLKTDLQKAELEIARVTKDKDVILKARVDLTAAKTELAKAKMEALGNDAGKEASSAFSGAFNGGLRSPGVLVPGIVAALAVLPGAVAVGGAATGIALGTAIALSTDKTLQAQGKGIVTQLKTTLGDAVRESGFTDALSGAMSQVSAVITKIGPEFKQTFGDVAPLLTPVVNMISDLASNALPGFNSMLRDAQGPLTTFFNSAGKIVGTGLGKFFAQLGPAVGPSLQALTSLLSITVKLLPAVAGLATTLADTLGPVLRGIDIGMSAITTSTDNATSAVKNLNGTLAKQAVDNSSLWGKFVNAVVYGAQVLSGGVKHAQTSTKDLNKTIAASPAAIESTKTALWELASKINDNVTASDKARQAWDKYIGVMTGSFGSLQALQDDMSTLAGDIRKVSGSLDGNSKAARQYHADLDTALNDSESYITKLRDQATAAGNTKAAQSALSEGIKGTIAQLIPAASKSATARAEVLALARANGINASSFQDLTGKVGSSTDATHKMTSASNKLTTASANATGASKTLKQKIDDLGSSLHLTKGKTDDLYNSIKNLPKNKRVTIDEIISGKGKVSISGNWATQTQSNGATQSVNVKTGQSQYRSPNGYSYAQGGHVTGPGTSTSDSIPARLSNGEYVINAAAVRKVGKKHLDAVNSGALFGYASGGLVNNSQTGAGVAAGNRSLIHDTVKFTIPTIQSLSQSAVNAAVNALKQAAQSSYTGGLNPTGSGATVQALMKSMAASIGWTGAQWDALNYVEMREAGYNLHARNPSSGAYGLAQGISGPSWYYQYGGNPNTAAGQITAMLRYIAQRYGSPIAAAAHERSMNWYSQGGTAMKPPGVPSTDRFLVRVGDGERISSASEVRRSEQQHGPTTEQLLSMVIQRLDQQNMYAAQTSKYTSSVAKNTGGLSPIRGIGR